MLLALLPQVSLRKNEQCSLCVVQLCCYHEMCDRICSVGRPIDLLPEAAIHTQCCYTRIHSFLYYSLCTVYVSRSIVSLTHTMMKTFTNHLLVHMHTAANVSAGKACTPQGSLVLSSSTDDVVFSLVLLHIRLNSFSFSLSLSVPFCSVATRFLSTLSLRTDTSQKGV